jgi:hypothetical protein
MTFFFKTRVPVRTARRRTLGQFLCQRHATMVAWYDDPSMFGYIVFSGLVVVFSIIIYISKPRSTRGT